MKIRAEGWQRRVVGWHDIAEIDLTETVSRAKAGVMTPGTTYVARHGENTRTAEGNLTVSRRSDTLALSGAFEVAVEISEADLARLLELFFKDRSANDVWQFMAKVFRKP